MVIPISPPADQTCKSCNTLRIDLLGRKGDIERLTNHIEIAKEQLADMETRLLAASGATIQGREAETIKKLQKLDLTQRRDLDLAYDTISTLRQEIDRLTKLCRVNKISVDRPGTPDASPIKPAAGWGAFTGSQGVGN